jgi:hypothetical protein
VRLYGPINKTTLGENGDGTVIRRMPNLAKFREDPDAMLVMSLEDYDEATGRGGDQRGQRRPKGSEATKGRGDQRGQERRPKGSIP